MTITQCNAGKLPLTSVSHSKATSSASQQVTSKAALDPFQSEASVLSQGPKPAPSTSSTSNGWPLPPPNRVRFQASAGEASFCVDRNVAMSMSPLYRHALAPAIAVLESEHRTILDCSGVSATAAWKVTQAAQGRARPSPFVEPFDILRYVHYLAVPEKDADGDQEGARNIRYFGLETLQTLPTLYPHGTPREKFECFELATALAEAYERIGDPNTEEVIAVQQRLAALIEADSQPNLLAELLRSDADTVMELFTSRAFEYTRSKNTWVDQWAVHELQTYGGERGIELHAWAEKTDATNLRTALAKGLFSDDVASNLETLKGLSKAKLIGLLAQAEGVGTATWLQMRLDGPRANFVPRPNVDLDKAFLQALSEPVLDVATAERVLGGLVPGFGNARPCHNRDNVYLNLLRLMVEGATGNGPFPAWMRESAVTSSSKAMKIAVPSDLMAEIKALVEQYRRG